MKLIDKQRFVIYTRIVLQKTILVFYRLGLLVKPKKNRRIFYYGYEENIST